ncbi:MAG: hypothetical protein QM504_10540 [Pseudomonadota bacterium]
MIKKINIALSIFLLSGAVTTAVADERKYLCISEASGGVVYKSGVWQGTSYKAGAKFLMVIKAGILKSVKDFGAPDDLAMKNCYALAQTKSFACADNFDTFRFQPSTKRFVMAKTSGYSNEFEEAGINLSPTKFTPNISIGLCELL